MALLAEEIVEEWLNRQGYFTIRGIKLGNDEIDLLAVRLSEDGCHCRHIEVQASTRPISYITHTGSARLRSEGELRTAVGEWIYKKYEQPAKMKIRETLAPGHRWSCELVVHEVKFPNEVEMIRGSGIEVRRLGDIVTDLKNERMLLKCAAGASLVELVSFSTASTR